jgi:FAD/FMN-containing dehydrogenase
MSQLAKLHRHRFRHTQPEEKSQMTNHANSNVMANDTSPSAARSEIAELRALLPAQVVAPGDAQFDTARAVAVDIADRMPAAVVRATSAGDVALVVDFARLHGFEIAVRSGGHSGSGHGTIDGGIVIDLRGLATISVDPEARTVWAGGGASCGDVLRAAAAHGLVVPFGDTATVGIGGITTGGGVGYLSRLHGLTIDNLLAAEVVLADGRIVLADAQSEPDLFWAIRGGGGNFGVVTRFLFQATPLGEVTGGMLVIPADAATIAGFVRAAQDAPEAFGVIATVMPAFPAPFIPEAHRGRPMIMANMAFAGPAEEAEKALEPFRALARPFLDTLKRGPYLNLYPDEENPRPGMPEQGTMFVNAIDEAAAQTIIDFLNTSDSIIRMVQIRVLGGAVNRVAAHATAYAHRRSPIMLYMLNFWTTPAERPKRRQWLTDLTAALHQGDEGLYSNFLGDAGPDQVRAAYPGDTWLRLRQLKRRYDPSNAFRRNHNIPPAD